MFRFHFHSYAVWVKRRKYRVGNLASQPFLDLGSPGSHLQGPGQFANSSDLPARNVSKMGETEKGKEVMLADRVKRNASQYHWVVAVGLKYGVDRGFWVESYT